MNHMTRQYVEGVGRRSEAGGTKPPQPTTSPNIQSPNQQQQRQDQPIENISKALNSWDLNSRRKMPGPRFVPMFANQKRQPQPTQQSNPIKETPLPVIEKTEVKPIQPQTSNLNPQSSPKSSPRPVHNNFKLPFNFNNLNLGQKVDEEKLIIIALMILLYKEKADLKLILALGYLI